jgi:hypothetical protein
MRWLAVLPYHDFLELDADESAPRGTRRRIATVLPEWGLQRFEVAASLVASEIVTNALIATRGVSWVSAMPPVLLWLIGGPSVLAILAWDAVTSPPTPRGAADYDESGRGLAIVGALSADWGFYYPAKIGKITWAIIDTPLEKGDIGLRRYGAGNLDGHFLLERRRAPR